MLRAIKWRTTLAFPSLRLIISRLNLHIGLCGGYLSGLTWSTSITLVLTAWWDWAYQFVYHYPLFWAQICFRYPRILLGACWLLNSWSIIWEKRSAAAAYYTNTTLYMEKDHYYYKKYEPFPFHLLHAWNPRWCHTYKPTKLSNFYRARREKIIQIQVTSTFFISSTTHFCLATYNWLSKRKSLLP